PLEEHGLTPLQIWCNESQERYVLSILEKDLDTSFVGMTAERILLLPINAATSNPVIPAQAGI
ncbi:hypothetical protein, partial [Neisseria meningitidis]|uniref:hypothetical protein n=1 Tax=Neisseria meningitidis TaxID=487 RepID=UPI0018CB328F